jgi:endonuclease/exonuclease/phosphatase family metal-dependent hydrolase
MEIIVRFLWLLLFLCGVLKADFSIATYNVENLFDAKNQGSEYDDYRSGTHNWNETTAQVKLNHTAEVICDINSDIIGLQEIENISVFEELISRLKQVGCEYKYSAITSKADAPIQIALLSRYPIISKREIIVSPDPKVRNILEVLLDIDDNPIRIFVNHWKSKSNNGKESARVRAALSLNNRISQLPASDEYIIIGDLNSRYDAPDTLESKLDDTNGRTAIGDVLHTYVDHRLADKAEVINSPNKMHYNLWGELAPKDRWNHQFFGDKSSIDHIILPRTLFNGKGMEYKNGTFMVFAPSYLKNSYGNINHWKIEKGMHKGKGYSDHLPLRARFTMTPFKLPSNFVQYKTTKQPIEYLYLQDALKSDVFLENAVVIWQKGANAIIKQSPQGRGVFLYKCAKGLKVGNSYNLFIHEIKNYNGLKEVTNLSIDKKNKSDISVQPFMLNSPNVPMANRQNEIIKEISGIYRDNKIYFSNKSLPVFFKTRASLPMDGSKIKISYGHLGYYKKLQLVVYDKNDFEILE